MFVLNCDVCDARKVKEEALSGYEKIIINADTILVNDHAREVLSCLPLICNANGTLEPEGDVNLISHNGSYEINGSTAMPENTVLCINGSLTIRPGAKEALSSLYSVSVNGSVLCPVSLSAYLSRFHVNGSTECYPDDCIVLDAEFTPNAWFAPRARQERHYFVASRLRLTESGLDVSALAQKKVRFITPSALVPEGKPADAVLLFDETVKLTVIPSGYAFVSGDAVLDEALLAKYGGRLYIEGSLTVEARHASLLSRLEKPRIAGTVYLPESLEEPFRRTGAEYETLSFIKGRMLANKALLTVDDALLDASPDGVSIRNCGLLRIHNSVSAERILELVSTDCCGCILCSPQQKGAVELVSRNAGFIGNKKEEARENGGDGFPGLLKQLIGTKVTNADLYVL